MLRGTAPRMVPGALAQIQSSMVSRMIPGFGSSGTKSGTTHSTKHSISSLMRWWSGRSAREWFEEQLLLPLKNQNAIVKWRTAMVELLRRPGDADDDVSTGHTLTGPAKAYQCFGYDLYWLQLVHRLPDSRHREIEGFSEPFRARDMRF